MREFKKIPKNANVITLFDILTWGLDAYYERILRPIHLKALKAQSAEH